MSVLDELLTQDVYTKDEVKSLIKNLAIEARAYKKMAQHWERTYKEVGRDLHYRYSCLYDKHVALLRRYRDVCGVKRDKIFLLEDPDKTPLKWTDAGAYTYIPARPEFQNEISKAFFKGELF